jgi:formylglycine-generating enzyme required for sulfatase activity
VGVSWYEAVAFCKWLNKSPKYARNTIQLPSEAEWERAARGAKKRSRTSEGHESDLGQRCNCVQSGIGHTSAVGLFPSGDTPPEIGELGIADLAGNVWEWCRTQWLDNYAQNYDEVISDELAGDNNRVLRGGSWLDDDPRLFSPSYRYFHSPSVRSTRIGFRLVCLGASVGNMLAAKTEKDARGAAWATRLRPQRRKVSEPLAPLPAKAKKRGAGRGR